MSLQIAANETGVIRVFALSMSDEKAQALKANLPIDEAEKAASSLQELVLGSVALNETHVEVFALSDLGDMALADYLIEGAGAQRDLVEKDRFKLSSLDGWVMVVYSSAFRGVAQTINPSAQLTLVGTYTQEGVDWKATVDLSTSSALPQSTQQSESDRKKRPSDAAMSGRIAMLALLVAFIVVGLMVWVGS